MLAGCALAVVSSATAQFGMLREALPRTEGSAEVAGITAPLTIERDGLGVPRIEAATEADAIFALGYVHGQERFLQMDLARRYTSGRLAELAGPDAVGIDRTNRVNRFAAVAAEVVKQLAPRERILMNAYVAGVNAGLDDLDGPPIFHRQLGVPAEAWTAEDSVLVLLSMFDFLNEGANNESSRMVGRQHVPPAVFELLTVPHSRLDAPMLIDESEVSGIPPLPGPDVIDARAPRSGPSARPSAWPSAWPAGGANAHANALAKAETSTDTDSFTMPGDIAPGSNAWVVAGSHTASGAAILANDPHLQLSIPGIWYQAELRWPGGTVAGVSLPGSPGIVFGSNARVAWGFTNTTADFQDLVVVEIDPANPDRYRVPGGTEAFIDHEEVITVRGAAPVTEAVRWTRWGPLTGDVDPDGRPLALRWAAHDAGAVNFAVLDFASAADVPEALAIARRWYGPSQNVHLAGADGQIAWTISGWLPDRVGFDGRHPVSWADGTRGWHGPMDEAERPQILNPESGIIWTANHRTMSRAAAARFGFEWATPGRAHRIREQLVAAGAAGPNVTEDAMFDLQLDTRTAFFDPFAALALAALESMDLAPGTIEARLHDELAAWDGHARRTTTVMRFLMRFRSVLARQATESLWIDIPADDRRAALGGFTLTEPALRIVEARPDHLLPPRYADWDALVASAVSDTIEPYDEDELFLAWGDANRADIRHPVSEFSPDLGVLLNLPPERQDGHWAAIRVATPRFGASMRMVVAPGAEDRAILHTPAGQSGHPGMPTYRRGHAPWSAGRPSPMLAGRAATTVRLLPRDG
ncbi:MAG: penicillin acylase family protein [Phycisphaerales bacterium]